MTTLLCRLGLFKWLVTPIELINAPAQFQRYINQQLRKHLDVDATAYMGDLLVYTNGSLDENLVSESKILQKLEEAGLFLDIIKCEIFCKKVKYSEVIIRAGESVAVDPEKAQAIVDQQPPAK